MDIKDHPGSRNRIPFLWGSNHTGCPQSYPSSVHRVSWLLDLVWTWWCVLLLDQKRYLDNFKQPPKLWSSKVRILFIFLKNAWLVYMCLYELIIILKISISENYDTSYSHNFSPEKIHAGLIINFHSKK